MNIRFLGYVVSIKKENIPLRKRRNAYVRNYLREQRAKKRARAAYMREYYQRKKAERMAQGVELPIAKDPTLQEVSN